LQTTCDRVWQVEINNQKENRKHVNIEFTGVDLDINSRIVLGLYSVERIFRLKKLSTKDSIMISFRSHKIVNSFFTIDGSVIYDLSNGVINAEQASKEVWESGNVLMFPINDDFRIEEIEDISNEKQKRFKAIAYIKRAKRKHHVQEAVNSIVDQLRALENHGFSSHKVKHGKMETDIIYLVLYKNAVRSGKDRALFLNNDNFIA
jgi:hypothetical protein